MAICFMDHRENGGGPPWDGGPLIINPIYTLYSGYLLGTSIFPMNGNTPHERMISRIFFFAEAVEAVVMCVLSKDLGCSLQVCVI